MLRIVQKVALLKSSGLGHSERRPDRAEVEESIEKQISRLVFGSLEMTINKVFNRA